MEIVQFAANLMAVATDKGFRLRHSPVWQFPAVAPSLHQRGDVEVTRQMLAAAIYAGYRVNQKDDGSTETPPEGSLLRYIYSLANMYHTTHSTVLVQRRAEERLREGGHDLGAARSRQVVEEEEGHDLLALRDLAAFGVRAEEFVERFQPKGARALAVLYQRICESEQPIGVFGYVYVLERLALFSTAESIAEVERLIPKGIKATRCMRVHSSIGSDTQHVEEFFHFIASLDVADRAAIIRAAFDTSCIVHADHDDYPGDAVMCQALVELGADYLFSDRV